MKKDDPFRSQFCTCHDSSAVVTCAILWPGWIITIIIIARKMFTNFWYELLNTLWNRFQQFHGIRHIWYRLLLEKNIKMSGKNKKLMGTIEYWYCLAASTHHKLVMNSHIGAKKNGCILQMIFPSVFLDVNGWISIKFAPEGPINNKPPVVQLMAWYQKGNDRLS